MDIYIYVCVFCDMYNDAGVYTSDVKRLVEVWLKTRFCVFGCVYVARGMSFHN